MVPASALQRTWAVAPELLAQSPGVNWTCGIGSAPCRPSPRGTEAFPGEPRIPVCYGEAPARGRRSSLRASYGQWRPQSTVTTGPPEQWQRPRSGRGQPPASEGTRREKRGPVVGALHRPLWELPKACSSGEGARESFLGPGATARWTSRPESHVATAGALSTDFSHR